MFGYIKPYKQDLKCKEMALYNAYYCSICRAIKKISGFPFCFGLSHDLTSFLFLQSALQPEEECIIQTTCIWNPFHKVNILSNYQDIIKYTAIVNMLLFYYKAKDNTMDNRNPMSFFIQVILWFKFIKLKKENAELNELIYNALQYYHKKEYNKDASIEEIIDPYAQMIGTIMSCLFYDPYIKKCLFWIGYHTAKSICIIDAIDDFDQDNKKKTNNILRQLNNQYCDLKLQNNSMKNEKEISIKKVFPILNYSLYQIKTTIDILPILRNHAVIENIFNEGINNSVTNAVEKRSEKK